MLIQAHSRVWAQVQDDLRRRLGEERFGRWVAPLKVLSESGEEIRLGVPNRFVLDWVEKRYVPEMESVLKEREAALRVQLVIDPELYRERRQEGEEVFASRRTPPAEGGSSEAPLTDAPRPGSSADETSSDMTLDSFVVGESNQLAFNAALEILDSPGGLYNPLFLHGSPGVGKTHLLRGLFHAFRHRRRPVNVAHPAAVGTGFPASGGEGRRALGGYFRVRYLTGEQFFNQFTASVQDGSVRQFRERYRSVDLLIIDDVHVLVNKRKTQVEFLHTFNSLVDARRQIVLASDAPPKALSELDPGLVGRFLSGLVAAVRKPELETRLGIVELEARRLGIRPDPEVIRFVAENIRGTARELIGAMRRVAIHAKVKGGTLRLEEVHEALSDLIQEQNRRISLDKIRSVVATHFGLTGETLRSASRQRSVVLARQIAMYLAREHTEKSLGEIGRFFGKRNHTTVRSAVARVVRLIDEPGGRVSRDLARIRDALGD